ncbi:MAG: hypothetical protein ACRYFX_10610 [Janthinobacterium lividum]
MEASAPVETTFTVVTTPVSGSHNHRPSIVARAVPVAVPRARAIVRIWGTNAGTYVHAWRTATHRKH